MGWVCVKGAKENKGPIVGKFKPEMRLSERQ